MIKMICWCNKNDLDAVDVTLNIEKNMISLQVSMCNLTETMTYCKWIILLIE